MGTLSLTDPVNGAVADATVIATNNAAIEAVVNGGIDNTNVDASAAIAVSKLAAGTNGQVLTTTGGVPVWGSAAAGETTYRKTTSKAVNTTTTATDLLNGEITVVAGVMGSTGMARLTAFGDWKQNSGGTSAPPRFQLVFGGTTIFDTGTSGTVVTNGTTRCGWKLSFEILNTASGAQVAACNGTLYVPTTTAGSTAFTTGEGTYSTFIASSAGLAVLTGYNSSSVDTTADKTLVLNVINGSANAAYETKLFGALVEII